MITASVALLTVGCSPEPLVNIKCTDHSVTLLTENTLKGFFVKPAEEAIKQAMGMITPQIKASGYPTAQELLKEIEALPTDFLSLFPVSQIHIANIRTKKEADKTSNIQECEADLDTTFADFPKAVEDMTTYFEKNAKSSGKKQLLSNLKLLSSKRAIEGGGTHFAVSKKVEYTIQFSDDKKVFNVRVKSPFREELILISRQFGVANWNDAMAVKVAKLK